MCPARDSSLPGSGCPQSPVPAACRSPPLLPVASINPLPGLPLAGSRMSCGSPWPLLSHLNGSAWSPRSLQCPNLICHCSRTPVLLQPSSSVYCPLVPAVTRAISPTHGTLSHVSAILWSFSKLQMKAGPSLQGLIQGGVSPLIPGPRPLGGSSGSEVMNPCSKRHMHNISHANPGRPWTLGVLVKNPSAKGRHILSFWKYMSAWLWGKREAIQG